MASFDEPKKPTLTRIARGTGPATTLSSREVLENKRALETVEKALGGRDAILDTLSVAADAPEVEQVVHLLLDPRYAQQSLRQICALAGLTVVDLFAAYKSAMIVRAHLVAYQSITDKILPVVEDVMTRAAPFKIPCPKCAKTGKWTDPDQKDAKEEDCPACAGHGELLQLPDLDRQKLALELAQLVQKSGGVTLQQNNLTLHAADKGKGSGSTLVGLQQAVRDLLSGAREPLPETVEAAPVEDDPLPDAIDAEILVPVPETYGADA